MNHIQHAWKEYAADFDNMTDEEIQFEVDYSRALVDEHESWLEAVASWKQSLLGSRQENRVRKRNKPMLKTLTILLTLTVLPAIATAQSLTNTCAPNQMTISDAIKSMRSHNLKVVAYDGDNAKVVRDYMEKVTGMEMLEFDAIIFGSKGQAPNTLAMIAKRGCVFNGGPVATELYLRVVAEVEGV